MRNKILWCITKIIAKFAIYSSFLLSHFISNPFYISRLFNCFYDNNITNGKSVSAEIEKVRVDHNDFDSNGNSGMKIHVKFTVRGMLNEQGSCALYFYDENGNALEDANDSYCTSKGTVATQKNFKPSYENSVYKDFKIFMPYSELHLKATTSCYFRVIIWSGSEELVRSGKYSFNYVVN